ncbi:MAG: methanogen output domain 1-containing protein [Myxococcales bacterium]|nr:methanogen output domain 1-containing protein [Myxococcales bacterium]
MEKAETHRLSLAVQNAEVSLDRDGFLRDLIGELSGALQDIVGLDEAAGLISIVGQSMGERIDQKYRRALNVERLDRGQVQDVLIDLKRRIQGTFHVVEEAEDRIVFANTRCPFEDRVKDRPSLCMMTSNVFGTIASENLGYARVRLARTIARGDQGCRVVLFLRPEEGSVDEDTREYYGSHSCT